MDSQLLIDVYNQIVKAVSGTTNEVHFLFLPDEKLLKKVTVTYEMNNTANDDTFDSKEAIKTYSLKIRLNAPQSSLFGNLSIYIKQFIYQLKNINSSIKYINLKTDELFYDNELKVYTDFLNFEIQYT